MTRAQPGRNTSRGGTTACTSLVIGPGSGAPPMAPKPGMATAA